jgi:hypothetical protein
MARLGRAQRRPWAGTFQGRDETGNRDCGALNDQDGFKAGTLMKIGRRAIMELVSTDFRY